MVVAKYFFVKSIRHNARAYFLVLLNYQNKYKLKLVLWVNAHSLILWSKYSRSKIVGCKLKPLTTLQRYQYNLTMIPTQDISMARRESSSVMFPPYIFNAYVFF
jgi:hypothetical protein